MTYKNKEKQQIEKTWRKRHPDYMSTFSKIWRKENKDRIEQYVKRNKERIKANRKRWQDNQRLLILGHYSNHEFRCSCCGISNLEFLCLDHVNGGGNKEREKYGQGRTFYKYLIDNNYPEGYRVLCHNCNMAFGVYGYCPHQSKEDRNEF